MSVGKVKGVERSAIRFGRPPSMNDSAFPGARDWQAPAGRVRRFRARFSGWWMATRQRKAFAARPSFSGRMLEGNHFDPHENLITDLGLILATSGPDARRRWSGV